MEMNNEINMCTNFVAFFESSSSSVSDSVSSSVSESFSFRFFLLVTFDFPDLFLCKLKKKREHINIVSMYGNEQ